jgi:hypothetical protein
MASVNKEALFARLLSMPKVLEDQKLFNAFGRYFAEWIKNVYAHDVIFSENYPQLIKVRITCLRLENLDLLDDEDLVSLARKMKGENTMKDLIKDFFVKNKDIVEWLTSPAFYAELPN